MPGVAEIDGATLAVGRAARDRLVERCLLSARRGGNDVTDTSGIEDDLELIALTAFQRA